MDEVDSKAATTDERPTASDDRSQRPSAEGIGGERYCIVDQLGRGGMGEVLVARDQQIGRDVAIKRMRAAEPSDRSIQRFLREAHVQGRLEHPAIVPVHEIGRAKDGLPFFVMKKLAGKTLASLIGTDEPRQRLLRAFVDVCLAIEFAHVRGVIHRDLKPDNIMLGDFGEVYVLDWGVAKIVGEGDAELAEVSGSGDGAQTGEGMQIGTPGYMAPEQVRGELDVDARADVYALGCVLYAILAGVDLHVRGKKGLASALLGVDARPSVRAPDRNVPPELDAICVAATHVDREVRTASARELGDLVQRFLDGDRDLATRRELALEHLARGRAAYARDDRSTAMREAGSALALDPQCGGAAELLGGLMLEPPKTIPPDVEAAFEKDAQETAKINARTGVFIYLAILAFIPLLWWIAPGGSTFPVLFAIPVVVSIALCWYGTIDGKHGTRLGWLAFVNAGMILLVARNTSPLFIAPGFAAVAAMTIIFTPSRSRFASPLALAIMMELAVLGPWLCERLDLISRTMVVGDGAVHFRAFALGAHESRTTIVATLYVFTLIAIGCIVAGSRRAHEEETKRQLLVQAWQLRQLLPR